MCNISYSFAAKNEDKSQVDSSRLNISGEEALVIVDGRVFQASIETFKEGLAARSLLNA